MCGTRSASRDFAWVAGVAVSGRVPNMSSTPKAGVRRTERAAGRASSAFFVLIVTFGPTETGSAGGLATGKAEGTGVGWALDEPNMLKRGRVGGAADL